MGEQKVENALATGADYLISTDLSCLMHLQGYIKQKGHSIKTMHLADVLATGWQE
jgi:L-lactate dehydrogenase complex protein LldE